MALALGAAALARRRARQAGSSWLAIMMLAYRMDLLNAPRTELPFYEPSGNEIVSSSTP